MPVRDCDKTAELAFNPGILISAMLTVGDTAIRHMQQTRFFAHLPAFLYCSAA